MASAGDSGARWVLASLAGYSPAWFRDDPAGSAVAALALLALWGTAILGVLNATLEEVRANLAERGIALGLAELHADAQGLLDRAGLLSAMGRDRIFEDLDDALRAFETKGKGVPREQEEQEGARE
jgi:hypothetical protein